jgi:hypothetical protein
MPLFPVYNNDPNLHTCDVNYPAQHESSWYLVFINITLCDGGEVQIITLGANWRGTCVFALSAICRLRGFGRRENRWRTRETLSEGCSD